MRIAALAIAFIAALVAPRVAAALPPANSGCGESGPTRSNARPTAALVSPSLTLRWTGRVRLLVRGNQSAAATVSIMQAGGRRLGGTPTGSYTCTTPGTGIVSLALNHYGRTLVRRHGQVRVRLAWHLVNGSGIRNTVRLSGVIRPG